MNDASVFEKKGMNGARGSYSVTGTAIFFALIGVLLLIANLDIVTPGMFIKLVVTYWPMAFVGAGLYRMISANGIARWSGLVPMSFGTLLQMMLLGWLPGDPLEYWPIMFLLWGAWLLFDRPAIRKGAVEELESARIELDEMMNLRKVKWIDQTFSAGRIECTLSLLTLDLSRVRFPESESSLTIDGFLSRIIIELSPDVRVVDETRGFFSRVRNASVDGEKVLRIGGSMMFGVVVIQRKSHDAG